jgi:hypothetical protein
MYKHTVEIVLEYKNCFVCNFKLYLHIYYLMHKLKPLYKISSKVYLKNLLFNVILLQQIVFKTLKVFETSYDIIYMKFYLTIHY